MFIECAAGALGRSPDSRQNKKPLRSLTGAIQILIRLVSTCDRENSVNKVKSYLRRQNT